MVPGTVEQSPANQAGELPAKIHFDHHFMHDVAVRYLEDDAAVYPHNALVVLADELEPYKLFAISGFMAEILDQKRCQWGWFDEPEYAFVDRSGVATARVADMHQIVTRIKNMKHDQNSSKYFDYYFTQEVERAAEKAYREQYVKSSWQIAIDNLQIRRGELMRTLRTQATAAAVEASDKEFKEARRRAFGDAAEDKQTNS